MSRDFTKKDKNMATIAENCGSGGVTLVLGTGGGGGGGGEGVGVGAVSAHSPQCCSVQGLSWDAV